MLLPFCDVSASAIAPKAGQPDKPVKLYPKQACRSSFVSGEHGGKSLLFLQVRHCKLGCDNDQLSGKPCLFACLPSPACRGIALRRRRMPCGLSSIMCPAPYSSARLTEQTKVKRRFEPFRSIFNWRAAFLTGAPFLLTSIK